MSYINNQFKDPWPAQTPGLLMSDGSNFAGSWSEWAIKKVVVSRANDEWPNLVAWIIARFFVHPDDTTRFFSEMANDQPVSNDTATALLGQPVSDDVAARNEAAAQIRSLRAFVRAIGKAIETRNIVWVNRLCSEPMPLDPEEYLANTGDHLAFSNEIELRKSIAERYLARAINSLSERQIADAFCSIWLAGMNAAQLEGMLESANCPVDTSSDTEDDFDHHSHNFSDLDNSSAEWDSDSASDDDGDHANPSSRLTQREWTMFADEWSSDAATYLPSLRMFPKGQARAFR